MLFSLTFAIFFPPLRISASPSVGRTKIITPSRLNTRCCPLCLSSTVDRRTMGPFSLWGSVTRLCPAQSRPKPSSSPFSRLHLPLCPKYHPCMLVNGYFSSFLFFSCAVLSSNCQGCLLKMTVGVAAVGMSQKTQNGRKTAAFSSEAEQQMHEHQIFKRRQTFCVVILQLAQAGFTQDCLRPDFGPSLLRLYNQRAWPNRRLAAADNWPK